jgi:hypothetical protein
LVHFGVHVSRLYLALGLLAACRITADFDGAQFACDEVCPADLECIAGRCQEPGAIDAGDAADSQPDAPICECTADTFADDCGASLVDISSGELVCASTEANGNDILGCSGAPQPGFDAAFRIAATAGQTITATVRPEGFDAAIYIVRDCSSTSCDAIADDVGVSGTETASVAAPATADYFIIVDSPTGFGCYELEVDLD